MQINKQDVVAVVLGGPSSEAGISRVTGGAIANALREKGYNAKELELEPANLINELRAMNAKVVFNAVHGMYGEDGKEAKAREYKHMTMYEAANSLHRLWCAGKRCFYG